MKIYYSTKFAREYKALPDPVAKRAESIVEIFKKDPFTPSLKTHKLSGILDGYWAFSINQKYRIIFEFHGKDVVWFHSVGDHEIYRS